MSGVGLFGLVGMAEVSVSKIVSPKVCQFFFNEKYIMGGEGDHQLKVTPY